LLGGSCIDADLWLDKIAAASMPWVGEAEQNTPPKQTRKERFRSTTTRIGTALIIVLVYAGSLLGYYYLSDAARSLGQPDTGSDDDTIVVVTLGALHTVDNTVDVKVLVWADDSLMDQRINVLKNDISVRLYQNDQNTIGDLQFPKGQLPAETSATLKASGDVDKWPFDTYTIGPLGADLLVGTGDARQFMPARVEVAGGLNGWDITGSHNGPVTQSGNIGDFETVTLRRARGPLAFDLGLCLVLLTLPGLALFVSVEMLRGRKNFLPPFGTWYAATLFAIIPIRNFMPGAPPPGAWIDQILVLWVLIALTIAMVLYFAAWFRRSD
jgi:hypothetical protein